MMQPEYPCCVSPCWMLWSAELCAATAWSSGPCAGRVGRQAGRAPLPGQLCFIVFAAMGCHRVWKVLVLLQVSMTVIEARAVATSQRCFRVSDCLSLSC